MSAGKVNFTSSILSDMTAKAAAFQDNKKPEQVVTTTIRQNSEPTVSASAENTADKPKNNVKRNTIVGLSAVAILIGLGVAGRKGKLGPKLQKFIGGAEQATERNATPERIKPQGTKPATEHTSSTGVTTNIDGGKVKLTREIKKRIAEIESRIDKDLPKIDESMKTIKIYTLDECKSLLNDKNFDITLTKNEKGYDLQDKINKIFIRVNNDGSFGSAMRIIGLRTSAFYDETGKISLIWKSTCNEDGHIVEAIKIRYKQGKISEILYYDINTGKFLKLEEFQEGKLYRKMYNIDGKPFELFES